MGFHQDRTSFFCSVLSDGDSLCLEQLSAKTGVEISRAMQSREEMRIMVWFGLVWFGLVCKLVNCGEN